MAPGTVNFDAPDLAAQIEQLSRYELDHLPFGVILLNGEGVVLFYSATEAQQSGYGKIPIGQNLFEISSCMASDDFRGRIMRAMGAVRRPHAAAAARSFEWAATMMHSVGGRSNASQAAK